MKYRDHEREVKRLHQQHANEIAELKRRLQLMKELNDQLRERAQKAEHELYEERYCQP